MFQSYTCRCVQATEGAKFMEIPMCRSFTRGFAFFLFLLALVARVWAQDTTAGIEGTVVDKAGFAVVNAKVMVTSLTTGIARQQQTDDNATFSFLALPVGDYRVEVTAPGFATWLEKVLHLNVSQKLRLPVELEIASASTAIEVSTTADVVQTSSTVLGSVVSGKEVLDLPLNGRNFSQLGLLQPGVRPMTAGLTEQGGSRRSGHAYAINGQRPESNNFVVDGTRTVNRIDGGFALKLPVDAIEEFKILTHTAPPEYGGTSGGNTTVVTRSGGNDLHGTFYEFVRNDLFDAKNYFSVNKEPLKQNQFGGTVGGPILKNKLFFFAYYEGFRNRQGITHGITVPTFLERSGDFSKSSTKPVDPQTGLPYPQDQIKAADFSPISTKILDWYPVPDTPDGSVATTTKVGQNDNNQGGATLDWMVSTNDAVAVRYAYAAQKNYNPFSILGSDTPGFPVGDYLDTHLGSIAETHTFSPRTIATFRVSLFRHYFLLEKRLSGLSPSGWGFGYGTTLASANGAPAILVAGYSNLGDPVIGPRYTTQNDFEESGSISHNMGAHSFKMGAGVRREQLNTKQGLYSNGQFTFNTLSGTGNAFANFLLGLPSTFQQAGGDFSRDLRAWDLDWFVQDEWRVSRRFLLNYGVRHEINTPYRELQNKLNAWIPGRQSVVHPEAAPGLLFPGDGGVPDTIAPTDNTAFMPRVGFSWDVTGNGSLVVHSGYAVFYDTLENGVGGPLRVASQTNPWTVVRSVPAGMNFQNPLGAISDPFVPGTFSHPASLFTIDSHLKPPYAQDWNLAIEQKIGGQVLTVSYVGTKGTHLPRFVEGNPAIYGPGATAQNADRRRLHAGCTAPTGPCAVGAVALLTGNSSSNYHAAEVHLTRAFSSGLGYNVSYTFSKTLDYVSSLHMAGPSPLLITGETDIAQNPFDLKAEYGPSLFDARHRLVACAIYDIPAFRNGRGLAHTMFGGWQINSIVTIASGTPFTVYDSRNVSLQAAHPSISGAWGDRPNVVSDPNAGPHKPGQWVSRSAFQQLDAVTQAGQFGNERRNSARGPGYGNLDLSFLKSIPISERWKMQIRAECFNATNHTNFGLPVNDLNSPSFGKIMSAASPRVLQLALKIMY